ITVSTSTHLALQDKVSTSNKCPLKISLIGILQEMLQEVKSNENAILQTLITDYIGEEYNFIVKITFLYLNPHFVHLKNTVQAQELLIFVVEQMEIFNNEFYVYATEINFVNTHFESKKESINNITQATSAPKNLIHSKLFVMHQNISENKNKTLKSIDSSDNFETISLSVSYSSKHIQVEDDNIEQTSYKFDMKKNNSTNQNHEK
ncbi:28921_t:CDS:1, partial [Racocetra persica]